jgi:choline kinase
MEIALVYLAAGVSSRFGGKIKQLVRVGPNNETFIEYSMKQALTAGFTKIIFIVGNKTEEPFKEEFGNNYKGIPIFYALQNFDEATRDKPWGTTDALASAEHFLNCPFVICNGDDIYGEEPFKILVNHIKSTSGKTGAAVGYKLKNVLPKGNSENRGIFQVNSQNEVQSIKEELGITWENMKEKGLTEETLCSMNVYTLPLKTLSDLSAEVRKFKEEHSGNRKVECLLPEELGKLVRNKKLTIKLYPTNERMIGITHPEDEFKVRKELENLSKIN